MSHADFPGHLLEERRLALGLSLMDIYGAIHVPIVHLQALEQSRFDLLPERTYVCGFLQSYCEVLGLAPEPLLDRIPTANAGGNYQMRKDLGPLKTSPWWLGEAMAWGSICLLLTFGWFAYTILVRPVADNEQQPVEAGMQEVTPPRHFVDEF